MEQPMGYRNYLAANGLAAAGRLTVTRRGVRSFDPMQYALLTNMAWLCADWPLDEQAERMHMLPRTYTQGWSRIAEGLGMTLAETPEEIVDISDRPRAPHRERLAANRISQAAGKLEAAGLIKCLRKGSVQRKNNAVWLLMLGDREENMQVEEFVRSRMRL